MKKQVLLLFALLPMMAWAQFDSYFAESSLRVDYCLTGNRTTTTFSLKEFIHEPYWSGSKTNLIDNLEFGNYIVKVYENGTDKLLFSKGYQNLYGEWQTTDEAKVVTKTFDESVIADWLAAHGESLVFFRDGSIIKVHVHTPTPGEILNHCQQYGEYLTVKIENMTLQHHENRMDERYRTKGKALGVVAVAAGSPSRKPSGRWGPTK